MALPNTLRPAGAFIRSDYIFYTANDMTRTRTQTRLDAIRTLSAGWHYGEGVPPSADTIQSVEQLYAIAAELGLRTDVFPNVDGSIMLAVYLTDRLFEFVAHSPNLFTVYQEIGGVDEDPRTKLDFVTTRQLLSEIAPHPWSLSDLSTAAPMIVSFDASNRARSQIVKTESQWSTLNASWSTPRQYMPT